VSNGAAGQGSTGAREGAPVPVEREAMDKWNGSRAAPKQVPTEAAGPTAGPSLLVPTANLVDEVPSIVAQFADKEVDPPAEARPTTSKWDPVGFLIG